MFSKKALKGIATGLVALMVVCSAGFAWAATTDTANTSLVITSGDLAVDVAATATIDFSAIDFTTNTGISGGNMSSSASLGDFTIQDFTGQNDGWTLSVQASTLTSGTNTIPGVMKYNAGSTIAVDSSVPLSDPVESSSVTGDDLAAKSAISTDTLIDGTNPVTIFSAGAGYGKGKYNVSGSTLSFNAPIGDLTLTSGPNTFNSTITFTISNQ